MYEFKSLPPGTYTLRAFVKGFQPFTKEGVTIAAGKPISENIQLEIATQNEKVEVQDSGTQLDVTASGNASSVVLKGKDLDALSDDPDELQSELQALAGPSAVPNGGQSNIEELSVINTPALDANLNPIQFTDSVPNPRTRTEISPRLDYQVTQNNTLTVRYQYERNNEQNDGIGTFSLPSQGTNNFSTEH